MEKLKLEESQQIAVQTLKKLDKICKENDIQYFLFWGTLLGAIRHKGVIPWDDDIDIAMTRPNYDRFIAICSREKEKLKPYILQCKELNCNYPFNIARFCNNNYKLVYDTYDNYESGIFVDVYPIDGMGDDEDVQYWEKIKNKTKILRKHLYISSHTAESCLQNKYKRIIKMPLVKYCKWRGNKYYLDKWETKVRKYSWESSKYGGICTWFDSNDVIFRYPKSVYSDLQYVEFEGDKYPVPKEYDTILKELYGEYMVYPSKDKRKPYHEYSAYKIDMDIN